MAGIASMKVPTIRNIVTMIKSIIVGDEVMKPTASTMNVGRR